MKDTTATVCQRNFGQISMFKKGVTLRKNIESKFSVDMRIYTLCPS